MEKETMKALVCHAPNNYSLCDVPTPKITAPGDVIGRVTLAALCSSDIHAVHGEINQIQFPKIQGHECCVEIVEIGSAITKFKVGDRCVVRPGPKCGECVMCRLGLPASLCQNGGIMGSVGNLEGCHAEYIKVPFAEKEGQMYKIPEGMAEEDVILLTDMLATAWFGLNNAQVKPGQSLAVIGVGPVGLSTCLLAKQVFGAGKVIVIDPLQYRLDLAIKEGIADVSINPGEQDPVSKVLEITGGLGVDATIETPGLEKTMAQAVSMTRPAGVVSTVAVFSESIIAMPMVEMIIKGQQLKMGIQVNEGVPEMLEMIKDGKLDARFMLTHKAPLNDIMKGYGVFGNNEDGCVKWLITPYEY